MQMSPLSNVLSDWSFNYPSSYRYLQVSMPRSAFTQTDRDGLRKLLRNKILFVRLEVLFESIASFFSMTR